MTLGMGPTIETNINGSLISRGRLIKVKMRPHIRRYSFWILTVVAAYCKMDGFVHLLIAVVHVHDSKYSASALENLWKNRNATPINPKMSRRAMPRDIDIFCEDSSSPHDL